MNNRYFQLILMSLFLIGIGTSNCLGQSGNRFDHETTTGEHYAEQAVVSGARSLVQEQLRSVREGCMKLISEFSFLIFVAFIIALIKMIFLRQSSEEVIACGLETAAFLFLHAIDIVRYFAHALKRLALDLRRQSKHPDNSRPSQHSGEQA